MGSTYVGTEPDWSLDLALKYNHFCYPLKLLVQDGGDSSLSNEENGVLGKEFCIVVAI